MRLAVTSDLHLDLDGQLTPAETIYGIARRIRNERPDAVVLAGDLAHGLFAFSVCLECFADVGVPVGVLAGNHDVWRDGDLGSAELFYQRLPAVVREYGFTWLEHECMRIGDVSIVGSLAWYDYSAADVSASEREFAGRKHEFSNDAEMIDWPRTDVEIARELGDAMVTRFQREVADEAVRSIAVVTHVPIFEEQMTRQPHESRWCFSNAYYGNLTLGARVVNEPKLRAVVSGHTHHGRRASRPRGSLPALDLRVVASDYRNPAFTIVTL